uniref:Uncharacterized protein n=1 Tax=viral metagenome TaxID=1070528 RepID=A0A6C0ADZ5_9ZZZZ
MYLNISEQYCIARRYISPVFKDENLKEIMMRLINGLLTKYKNCSNNYSIDTYKLIFNCKDRNIFALIEFEEDPLLRSMKCVLWKNKKMQITEPDFEILDLMEDMRSVFLDFPKCEEYCVHPPSHEKDKGILVKKARKMRDTYGKLCFNGNQYLYKRHEKNGKLSCRKTQKSFKFSVDSDSESLKSVSDSEEV